MRQVLQAALVSFFAVLLFAACNATPPAEVDEQHLGVAREPLLLANGQACNSDIQCASNHCADTVCCNQACGNGARDNQVCSNVYNPTKVGLTVLSEFGPDNIQGTADDIIGHWTGGGAAPYVGTCVTLQIGDPCGDLDGLNPCTWRGSDVNGGNNCPAPGNGTPAQACYSCSATNNNCPPGLPICTVVNGVYGCTVCTGDFGSGGAGACPTSNFPICNLATGGCVECTATKPGACPALGKTCDPVLDRCVSCLTSYNGAPVAAGECPSTLPYCINPGLNSSCVQCTTPNDSVCTALGQVCDVGTNTCVGCLTSANCNATGPNPVCNTATKTCVPCTSNFVDGSFAQCPNGAGPPAPDLPACVSGSCKQCSATDETVCALTASTKHCSDTPGANVCVQCNVAGDCTTPPNTFCVAHSCTSTCASNADCSGQTPKCSAGGTCVQCLRDTPPGNGDADCAAVAGKPYCGTGSPQVGTSCVQCRTSADCSGTTPVCDGTGTCVPCNGNHNQVGPSADCPSAALPACKATGACVQCTNGAGGDVSQCTDPNIVCDSTTNTCVACTSDAQCSGSTPVCNLGTHTCTACTSDNGVAGFACPTPDAPACIGGTCFQCRSAAPSNLTACKDPTKTVCNAAHNCVQCTSDLQCAGNILNVCNLATNLCSAACTTNADCASTPATPVCKAAAGGVPAHCVQCTSSAQCGGATPTCDLATNSCVACLDDTACGGTTPICNGGVCVPCDGNRGDGTPAACKSATNPACVTAAIGPAGDVGKCVECSTTESSLCIGAKPACNATSHTCVACGSNAQCAGNTPICNPAGTCVACNGDLGSNASAQCYSTTDPACVTTAGANLGSCQQCNAGNVTACSAAAPVCDVVANDCVECNVNADCHGPNGICNTQQHVCTLGCTSDANCTVAAPACKLPDQFCVQCTAANTTACTGTKKVCDVAKNVCVGCLTTKDCPADTPVCDATTKTCIATCTESSQCPGDKPVCDPQTKTCVGCVDNTNCTPPLICNTNTHTCGTDCSKSSECPGDAPVCDPQTKKCVGCVANSDCPGSAPICDSSTHTCGNTCSKSSDCPGDVPICDPQTKNCVQCESNLDCPPPDPVCNPTNKKCEKEQVSLEGGGCNCSTVPNKDGSTIPVMVGVGLALAAVSRRRRR